MGNIAAHVAGVVRHREDRADRPAALNTQRERGVFLLEHFAEERRAAECTAERRRADGVQTVNVPRALDHVGRGDDRYFGCAVVRYGTKNFAHNFFSLRYGLADGADGRRPCAAESVRRPYSFTHSAVKNSRPWLCCGPSVNRRMLPKPASTSCFSSISGV